MSKQFAYVYDDVMQQHASPYDPQGITQERPERTVRIHERLVNDGLLKDARKIELRRAEDWELQLIHPKALLDELDSLHTVEELEEYCRWHELLWLCAESSKIARLVVGGVIDNLIAIVKGEVGNSFSITRPPGHHSFGMEPEGFCLFNNVAIAAKYAVEKLGVKRVLIVDIDYHCGNGTHHAVKGDERILFANFYAHHFGAFWPYLDEYDYDSKFKNVLSFPMNAALTSEGDYIAALKHFVIPVALEAGTELVLVSLGFDSAYYDDLLDHGQGIKAHGYGHIMKLLNEHWPNKVFAVLEGGYFAHSYTECASMATKGLQGLPLPALTHPERLNPCVAQTLWNCLSHHAKWWKSAADHLGELQKMQEDNGLPRYVLPSCKPYVGREIYKVWEEVVNMRICRTRDWVPGMSKEGAEIATAKINEYIQAYDYKNPTRELSHDEFLAQMRWNSEREGDAFILGSRIVLWWYDLAIQALNNYDSGKFIIVDVHQYREKTKRP